MYPEDAPLTRILHECIDFNRFLPLAWRGVSGGGETGSTRVDFVNRIAISGSFSQFGGATGGFGAGAPPGKARPGWKCVGMRPYLSRLEPGGGAVDQRLARMRTGQQQPDPSGVAQHHGAALQQLQPDRADIGAGELAAGEGGLHKAALAAWKTDRFPITIRHGRGVLRSQRN